MSNIGDLSDSQLVVAVARCREEALAEIYRRHAGAVHGLARRVTGQVSDAEDVTQEIFVRLWREPDRFDAGRGSLRSFLLAQTHGRAVDLVRSKVSRRQREERDARRTANAGYDVERQAWDLGVADQVRQALDALTDGERDAIQLAYFGGHSYRDVAEMLAEPEGTVKSRIRSGLRRMRTVLTESGVSPHE